MEDLQNTAPIQEQSQEQEAKIDIAKIIEDLKAQGLEVEQIKEALVKMKDEGKIADEELQEAFKLLEAPAVDEKAEAEKLFGMKLI